LPTQDEAGNLGKTLGSARHKLLVDLIVAKREAAGLTQAQLAEKLGEYQSFVARLESGQRRIDVIEFIEISRVLNFDSAKALKKIAL
jgi:transcriptional regulator with XRE-family HTH domain